MRVDRFFEARFPGLSFSHIQRIIRKGEVRVNGKRAEPKDRLETGQQIRIPPLKLDPPKPRVAPLAEDEKTRAFLKSITLHEDDDVLVLNKPMGLAVQGGSGTTRHRRRHAGGAARTGAGRPAAAPGAPARQGHRRLPAGRQDALCGGGARQDLPLALGAQDLLGAGRRRAEAAARAASRPSSPRRSARRTRSCASRSMARRARATRSPTTRWSRPRRSTLAWLSLKPVTGRTHQLRAHMAHIGHPIVGDPKYFRIENWELPGGMQNRLHLLARRIAVPHPRGGTIDVTAPLPPHMQQTWNLLGFDASALRSDRRGAGRVERLVPISIAGAADRKRGGRSCAQDRRRLRLRLVLPGTGAPRSLAAQERIIDCLPPAPRHARRAAWHICRSGDDAAADRFRPCSSSRRPKRKKKRR